jgi:hypothetical protein
VVSIPTPLLVFFPPASSSSSPTTPSGTPSSCRFSPHLCHTFPHPPHHLITFHTPRTCGPCGPLESRMYSPHLLTLDFRPLRRSLLVLTTL